MKQNGVLIKSDRAIEAEGLNRFLMTKAKAKLREQLQALGVQATLYGCECLLDLHGYTGEWHHVSKFAREVDYYDVGVVLTLFKNAPSEELLQLAKSNMLQHCHYEGCKQVLSSKFHYSTGV